METAIYECDWYSSPMPFKKLVLMFLIRCRKPIIVHAKPFYQLNLALLAHVRQWTTNVDQPVIKIHCLNISDHQEYLRHAHNGQTVL